MNLSAHKKMLSAAAAASALMMTAACGSSESDPASPPAATSSAPAATSEAPAQDDQAQGQYQDGQYTATGQYISPAGPSKVDVEVTLADGVVDDVTVTPLATDGTSKQFQGQFAGGIQAQIKGVKLDDANVTKVAGSSLTGQGFNDAIEQIKAEASR